MKYNFKLLQKLLQKATKPALEETLRKNISDLRLLERKQAQNREAVRNALKAKDVASIKSLSYDISFIRRMPNGLHELNAIIAEIYRLLYKFPL